MTNLSRQAMFWCSILLESSNKAIQAGKRGPPVGNCNERNYIKQDNSVGQTKWKASNSRRWLDENLQNQLKRLRDILTSFVSSTMEQQTASSLGQRCRLSSRTGRTYYVSGCIPQPWFPYSAFSRFPLQAASYAHRRSSSPHPSMSWPINKES